MQLTTRIEKKLIEKIQRGPPPSEEEMTIIKRLIQLWRGELFERVVMLAIATDVSPENYPPKLVAVRTTPRADQMGADIILYQITPNNTEYKPLVACDCTTNPEEKKELFREVRQRRRFRKETGGVQLNTRNIPDCLPFIPISNREKPVSPTTVELPLIPIYMNVGEQPSDATLVSFMVDRRLREIILDLEWLITSPRYRLTIEELTLIPRLAERLKQESEGDDGRATAKKILQLTFREEELRRRIPELRARIAKLKREMKDPSIEPTRLEALKRDYQKTTYRLNEAEEELRRIEGTLIFNDEGVRELLEEYRVFLRELAKEQPITTQRRLDELQGFREELKQTIQQFLRERNFFCYLIKKFSEIFLL